MRVSEIRAIVLVGLLLASLSGIAMAEEEQAEKNRLRVFYDQGFRLESSDGRYSLRINGLLQTRYTYVDYDPMIRFNQEDYSNLYVRRARLYFSGHAGSSRLTYFFHAQLEPNQGLNANDLWAVIGWVALYPEP